MTRTITKTGKRSMTDIEAHVWARIANLTLTPTVRHHAIDLATEYVIKLQERGGMPMRDFAVELDLCPFRIRIRVT